MPDPNDRAIRAIIHAITVNGGDATWTAHAILGALRGLGWRPTQATSAPDWQHRDVPPAPPNAAYLAARPPTKDRI
jgi:hypothetical protein